MIITKLEGLDKGKVKVYIDWEYHFLLYNKDIKVNKLVENEIITEAVYDDILKNTVLRRGKQKAISILKFMDRSEQELKLKLKQADYTDSVISMILDYIKSYHYIDDTRYAQIYIRTKKESKSLRQIQMELMNKGIQKSIIEEAFTDEYETEDSAIMKAISKKCKDLSSLSKEDKIKLAASLYRKGFRSESIKKHLNDFEDNY